MAYRFNINIITYWPVNAINIEENLFFSGGLPSVVWGAVVAFIFAFVYLLVCLSSAFAFCFIQTTSNKHVNKKTNGDGL